ncbi:ATP/GTP-binding protein [Anaerovibrio lipolyticus]|uniref:AAA family ATPase n=1 Tax=Anaerovibrio lipolyticus TaxID=82374 RepID=UPI0026F35093|nr:AAA family ATPase [Anaerovibrio lipolyticus]
MLLDFRIKNYRSFHENQDGSPIHFSMRAGKVRGKKEHSCDVNGDKILKFAAIYGANASGKSNFIDAMEFMKKIVLRGVKRIDPFSYCKADSRAINQDSLFEVEISSNGTVYKYGFRILISSGCITEEWLFFRDTDGEFNRLFQRNVRDKNYLLCLDYFTEEDCNKLNIYISDTVEEEEELFLSVMNKNKKALYEKNEKDRKMLYAFTDVYRWFKYNLLLRHPDKEYFDYRYLLEEGNIEKVDKLLEFFDTGIKKLRIVEVPVEQQLEQLPKEIKDIIRKNITKVYQDPGEQVIVLRGPHQFFVFELKKDCVICKNIQFEHEITDVLFNLDEESDGTVMLLDLLEIFMLSGQKTYLVDEFDRGLHPLLSKMFINKFLEYAAAQEVQLIITTLEQSLMDFSMLRRDEIWGVDKEKGKSKMFSLEDKNVRFDKKVDKAYLNRVYGAVPMFNESSFPNL